MYIFQDYDWVQLPFNMQTESDETYLIMTDTHGYFDMASALYERIDKQHCKKIHLGDVTDRGSQNYKSMKFVRDNFDIRLFGNHDAFINQALMGNHHGYMIWSWNGGDTVLSEFGINVDELEEMVQESGGYFFQIWPEIFKILVKNIPQDFQEFFIDGFQNYHGDGNILFIHAGLNPSMSVKSFLLKTVFDGCNLNLKDEVENHWFWIRNPFLYSVDWEEKYLDDNKNPLFVFHGHTPQRDVYETSYRFCVDGGSYYNKQMFGVILEKDRYKVTVIQDR